MTLTPPGQRPERPGWYWFQLPHEGNPIPVVVEQSSNGLFYFVVNLYETVSSTTPEQWHGEIPTPE